MGHPSGWLLVCLQRVFASKKRVDIVTSSGESPEFSHESTADLFYDEAQFEAYRSLGYHIVMETFRRELLGAAPIPDIRNWFARLAAHLLEPAAQ